MKKWFHQNVLCWLQYDFIFAALYILHMTIRERKLPLIRSKILIPVDHKQYVKKDRRQLRSKVSRHNFFHKNQLRKYQAFQKPVGKTASESFPETSAEIASFCSDFNAWDLLNSERHLGASLRAEWKLITSQSELAIFLFLPLERNVGMTPKWHIWLVIDSWSLIAPIRNSVGGWTEFCKIMMTLGRRNLHSPTHRPLGTNFFLFPAFRCH